jgi:hypothetical protein
MTVSSGLAKGAVEAAAREVARLLGHGSADKNWHPAGSDHRDAKPLWQWCEGEARDAILAFLRHLKDKGPSEGMQKQAEFCDLDGQGAEECWTAMLSRLIEEMEGER